MRNLSWWAKLHPASARSIIIISHCLLALIAYFLGTQLLQFGIEISPSWICFLILVFFVAAATYPSKGKGNYTRRKLYDLIAAACSFFIMLCVTNQLDRPFVFHQNVQAAIKVEPSPYKNAEAKKLLEQFKNGEKTKFTRKEKRIIKSEFKYQLGQYAKAKITGRKVTAEQTLLIILACIGAVGLLYLLAGLACSISCNGSEALALIVFIAGTVAIVWGLIAIIRSINKKRATPKTRST
jgi:hypothetical protein